MTLEFSKNLGQGGREQTIHDVSVVSSQNVTFNQTQIIQISVEEVKTRKFIITSPYKGLKKFESEDKDHFFGRDQFLIGLVNELEQTNLVLLLGASGSGKSSVIRAGLIPWLAERQGSHLINLVFTPDQDPFESLYASLLGKYKQSEAQIARVAKEDTLTELVRSLKQADDYWFILIDQFEELFTTTESSKRDVFIKSLVQLVKKIDQAGDRSVQLVATMRADFLDRLSPHPDLIKITDKHRPMIAEMQLDELRLAIEQPAAHHGVVFESGLVKEIIDDVQGQAGYLPLLQYTLNLLWETEVQSQSIEDRTLNISNYRKLGGVRGALQQHVDQMYKSLSESEKSAAQRIFLKLVGIGENEESGTEWKPIRRRATRSEFSDPLEQTVLTQLVNQNLLVSNRLTDSQESTIEIAHEALLTSWITLNSWIKDNRQAINLRNRLNDDVEQWKKTKSNEDLWSGSKLEQILELRRDETFKNVLGGLNQEANNFVDISKGERDRIQKERVRLQRRAIQWLSGGLIAALIGAGVATWQSFSARRQSQIAFVRQLTSQAELARNQQANFLERSVLLAIEANRRAESVGALSAEAQEVLNHGLSLLPRPVARMIHWDKVNAVAFSPNRQFLATGSSDNTARIWDISTQKELTRVSHGDAINAVAFSPNGKYLATASADGTACIWEVSSGRKVVQVSHESQVIAVAFSPDGKQLATASSDRTARIWIVDNGKEISHIPHGGLVSAIAFNRNGQYLATASWDGTARVWDIKKNRELSRMRHEDIVNAVAFSPNGNYLATASGEASSLSVSSILSTVIGQPSWRNLVTWNGISRQSNEQDSTLQVLREARLLKDLQERQRLQQQGIGQPIVSKGPSNDPLGESSHLAQVWEVATGKQIARMVHEQSVKAIAFSPNNIYVATASEDKSARVWKAMTGQQLTSMRHSGPVLDVAFSPSGKYLATAGGSNFSSSERPDNTAHIWDTMTGREIARMSHDGPVFDVEFSADGKLIATASADNTAKIWDISHPANYIQAHSSKIRDVTFSPDGKYLATSSWDNTARIWDMTTSREIGYLQHEGSVENVNFSPDGKYLATASSDGKAKILEIATGKEFHSLDNKAGISSVIFSPDGKYLATAMADRTARVWEVSTGKEIAQMKHDVIMWNDLAFNPDGEYLITRGGESKDNNDYINAHIIFVWEAKTGRQIAQLVHKGSVDAWDFSPDGKYLATASSKAATLWELATGQEKFRLTDGKSVDDIAFSPDGQYIATANYDKTARLLKVPSGKEVAKLKHDEFVADVVFSPNGQYLATVSGDNTAGIWNLSNRKQIAKMSHKESLWPGWNEATVRPVKRIAFSSDGKYVTTASVDKVLHVWNAINGQEIANINHEDDAGSVESVAFSPDKRYLALALDNHIWIGKWWTSDVIAEACQRLSQNLSQDEWSKYLGKESYHPTCSNLPQNLSFITVAKEKAQQGDVQGAIAQFQQVQKLDLTLKFDPKTEAQWIAAKSLIQKAEEIAQEGDVAKAKAKFQEALKLDPNLKLNPEKEAQKIAAPKFVEEGIRLIKLGKVEEGNTKLYQAERFNPQINAKSLINQLTALKIVEEAANLAFNGNEADAIAKFQSALKLVPELGINPQDKARWLKVRGIIADADNLAHSGNVESAVVKFQAALNLDSNLKFDPRKIANQIFASTLVSQIEELSQQGNITKAINNYKQAHSRDSKVEISTESLNYLCWFGSLKNHAADVMFACEELVKLNPDVGSFRDSRGLARALTGNRAGAIDDFQSFIAWTDHSESRERRQKWIDTLRANQNPFTQEEKEFLLNER